jgi:hypothetical protein
MAPLAIEQQRLNLTSFEWAILRDRPRTYWLDVAWPLFGRYLSDMRATAAGVGAPMVVMAIPEMSQFDEQMRARTVAKFPLPRRGGRLGPAAAGPRRRGP